MVDHFVLSNWTRSGSLVEAFPFIIPVKILLSQNHSWGFTMNFYFKIEIILSFQTLKRYYKPDRWYRGRYKSQNKRSPSCLHKCLSQYGIPMCLVRTPGTNVRSDLFSGCEINNRTKTLSTSMAMDRSHMEKTHKQQNFRWAWQWIGHTWRKPLNQRGIELEFTSI